ncbi:cilia-and flagella-associated protein 96-like isoform X3 [Crassostrea virginica]
MGDKGGRTDMDRVGLFQEMGYVTINDKYKERGVKFNEAAEKGKQMLTEGSKEKSALQPGYFQKAYTRVFEGESYTDPIKLRRQHRLKEMQKNIGKPFLPSSGEKKPSGLGNHYGTLGGPIGAFSPASRPGKEYKSPGKNFSTNPGKKGTGFGYLGVTLGKYPNYLTDPFDQHKEIARKELQQHKSSIKGSGPFKLNMHPRAYFDGNPYSSDKLGRRGGSATVPTKKDDSKPFKPSSPGKRPAGMKAGTFDPYPTHSADPYKVKVPRSVNVVNKSGRTFMPSQGPKSTPTVSIVNQNVLKTINIQNYRSVSAII